MGGGNPCPGSEAWASLWEETADVLTRKKARSGPSALEGYFQILSADGGHLSLGTVFRMFRDIADRNKPVNRRVVEYRRVDSSIYRGESTIVERVEGMLREAGPDASAPFLRDLVGDVPYDNVARRYERNLRICRGIGFCGREIGPRAASNILNLFSGIYDLNGMGLSYGPVVGSLLSPLVASADEGLLSRMASLSFFSNTARILGDRVGRTAEVYDQFLESRDLIFLEGEFLKNIDPSYGGLSAVVSFGEGQEHKGRAGKKLF